MRRLAAVVLVFLFAGLPVVSVLAATAASSKLPDCCKKDGAHMCSVRRGHAKQEDDGETKLSALCPFAGKTTLAVTAQRMGIAVGASCASTPIRASRVHARSQVLVLASTGYFENSKRGPPSVFLQS